MRFLGAEKFKEIMRFLTIFDISAETFRLPIEIPDPTLLQTKFSANA
jgi:hypothetical protein